MVYVIYALWIDPLPNRNNFFIDITNQLYRKLKQKKNIRSYIFLHIINEWWIKNDSNTK